MTTTGTSRPVGSTGLVWYLRAFAWLPVLCAVGLAAGALLLLARPVGYDARALVITLELEADRDTLPRYAASVFNAGAVAQQVADELGIDDPSALVPTRLDVITPEDSIVITVIGRDPDPNTAARLADAGAAAYVAELNRGGPSVGRFSVQSPAAVPTEPTQEFPAPLAAVSGGAGGAALGLGLVVLITVLRRPVVAAEDVRAAVGAELIGEVTVPRQPGRFAHPRDVPGVVAVARRIGDLAVGRFLFVSAPRDTARRRQVIVALGVALAGLRPTFLHGDPLLNDEMLWISGGPVRPLESGATAVVLVDQDEPLDLLRHARLPVHVVVVARKGVPASALRAAVASYLPSELLGVVFVEPDRRRDRQARATPAATAVAEPASV